MSANENGNGNQERDRGGFLKNLAERILVPLAAAAASAAAGYVAKNAPRLIEEKLLPRLRETSLPVVGDGGRSGGSSSESNNRAQTSASPDEREHARAERAARRDERKHAGSTTRGQEG